MIPISRLFTAASRLQTCPSLRRQPLIESTERTVYTKQHDAEIFSFTCNQASRGTPDHKYTSFALVSYHSRCRPILEVLLWLRPFYEIVGGYLKKRAVRSFSTMDDFLTVRCDLFFLCSASFLPLCSYSKIVRHITAPQWASDRRCFEATLTVGRPPFFQETYTSAVTVIPDRLLVETVSISSKRFDSLKSRWQLSTVFDQGGVVDYSNCAVSFEVELTVSDPIIIATLDKVLEQVAGRQVDAFAARCRQIPIATDLMASMGKQ